MNKVWLTNVNGVIDGEEGGREGGREGVNEGGRDGYAAKRALR